MKSGLVLRTALVLGAVLVASLVVLSAPAKEESQSGTVVAMNSVDCGTKGERHKKQRELICHEYVLRAGATEYHIRQKDEKSGDLLAIGQQATFTIHKDQMRLHAADTSGKIRDFQFVVISMAASTETPPTAQPQ
jgi:hypothetical protein